MTIESKTAPVGQNQLRTTAKVLTPSGRGAIAVMQVAGPDAVRSISDCFHSAYQSFEKSAIGAIRFGRWEVETGEELVIVRTADQQAEIHCHGGNAASEAILKSLASRGVEPDENDYQSNQADSSPLRSDALEALLGATTERVAACLLDQVDGAFDVAIASILQSMQSGDHSIAQSKLEELIAWKHLATALTQPWRVVLAGPPNVGKSSLVNALVGYDRVIVYDQPGTTRDVVTTSTALDGWPIQLSDTAGLRETDEPIEAAGVQLARRSLMSADLVLVVIEAAQVGTEASNEFFKSLRNQLPTETLMLTVASKADLVSENSSDSLLATSTLDGQGIAELLATISKTLVPRFPVSGEAIPFREWHFKRLKSSLESLSAGNLDIAISELKSLLAGISS